MKPKLPFIFVIAIGMVLLGVYILGPKFLIERKQSINGYEVIEYLQVDNSLTLKRYIVFVKDPIYYESTGMYKTIGMELRYRLYWQEKIVEDDEFTSFINDEEQGQIVSKIVDNESDAVKNRIKDNFTPTSFEIPPIIYYPFNFTEINAKQYYVNRTTEGTTLEINGAVSNITNLLSIPSDTSLKYTSFSENQYVLAGYKLENEYVWNVYDITNNLVVIKNISLPNGYVVYDPNNFKRVLVIGTNENDISEITFSGKIYEINLENTSQVREYEVPQTYIDARYDFKSNTIKFYMLEQDLKETLVLEL